MKTFALSNNPFLIWTEVLTKTHEMMFASLNVIAQRSGRMAAAGPFPGERDREEFALMGHEKVAAANESARNMVLRTAKTQAHFAGLAYTQMVKNSQAMMAIATSLTPMQAATRQMDLAQSMLSDGAATGSAAASAAGHIVGHGLEPVHGRATRNAKRLAKG